MKNFEIWLLPLIEAFVDALNTSDIHSNSLSFVFSKRGWFFQNRKIDSFPKEKIFPFGNTADRCLWYGLIMYFKSSLYKNLWEATTLFFYFLQLFLHRQEISFFSTFQNFFIQHYFEKVFCHKFSFFFIWNHWNQSTPFNTTTTKIY